MCNKTRWIIIVLIQIMLILIDLTYRYVREGEKSYVNFKTCRIYFDITPSTDKSYYGLKRYILFSYIDIRILRKEKTGCS